MGKIQIFGHCNHRYSEIERLFDETISSGFDTGASVVIEHHGEQVVNMWAGYTDADKTKLWSNDTLVNVFSITKAITAVCIIKLVDEGRLDLKQKVSYYWPEYGCNGKENTLVSDFLCHRAGMFGFREGMPNLDFADWGAWVNLLERQVPIFDPGAHQAYHAITFGWLVGEIVRRVDGRTIGQFFEEEIAAPFSLDFKIGLCREHFHRCADILMDPVPEIGLLKLLRFIPDLFLSKELTLIKKALSSRNFEIAFEQRSDDPNYVNTDEWRKAEIPSANGHGTAESLAKLFGILSTGCERDGRRLFRNNTLKASLKPLSTGPDMVLFSEKICFGVGFDIGLGITTIGDKKHPSSLFGHCGISGSVAFGDIENELGFAFLCNRIHQPKDLYKTFNQLTRALYKIK